MDIWASSLNNYIYFAIYSINCLSSKLISEITILIKLSATWKIFFGVQRFRNLTELSEFAYSSANGTITASSGANINTVYEFLNDFPGNFKKFLLRMRDLYMNPSKTKQNRVIWNFCFHETNPQNKSFKNESTKRIHETNLSKKVYKTNPRNKSFVTNMDSRIRSLGFVRIWACLKYVYVLRIRWIHKDSLDSWKQVESFENQSTKQIHETNLLKTLRIRDPRYETNPDLFCKAWIESFWSQDSWLRYETNPWIRKTNPRFYKSFIQFLHP